MVIVAPQSECMYDSGMLLKTSFLLFRHNKTCLNTTDGTW